MAGRLFEYAVLHHSKPTKAEEEQGKKPQTTVIVDVRRIVAADEGKAAMLAARDIPESYMDGKLDEVEIVIRPF